MSAPFVTVSSGDTAWPPRLDHLGADAPRRLWIAGTHRPRSQAVAVVGSRHPTPGGEMLAARIGAALSALGVQVVSGLALGIDAAAHSGALAAHGSTLAVLGGGVDVVYPRGNAALQAAIEARGALLSELAPGTPPLAHHFPRRNRIIAALVLAVVVVEATERSGALSTARRAADLGREILAVPGSPLTQQAAGCNHLLADGATPLLSLRALVEAVPAVVPPGTDAAHPLLTVPLGQLPPPPGEGSVRPPASGTAGARLLALCAGGTPVHPDTAAARLALSPARLSRLVGDLELAGLIRRDGGMLAGIGVYGRRPR